MSKAHSVFVLDIEEKPLTPTTQSRARKLLKASVAKPLWSKFSTFGIQLLTDSRHEIPLTALGYDAGTKYEGISVVVGGENLLNVKLDLPDKSKIVKKLEERRRLRKARRFRNCRRREARFDNRSRKDFLAPSQSVLVQSRLKVLQECFKLYPITRVGFEDVRFNHAKKRWGANFSTIEIGKARLKKFFREANAEVINFLGYQTKAMRENYGYKKSSNKAKDAFDSHGCDSLSLALEVSVKKRVEPGNFLVVKDTYRPVRRKLQDTQPAKGGIRQAYSSGTVFGKRKGLLIKAGNGKLGQLCGEYKGGYRFYDLAGKRQSNKKLLWVSTHFILKPILEETHSAPTNV
ncbi:MAG: RRXRR domain-containing protein [Planctomycetota bacterium]